MLSNKMEIHSHNELVLILLNKKEKKQILGLFHSHEKAGRILLSPSLLDIFQDDSEEVLIQVHQGLTTGGSMAGKTEIRLTLQVKGPGVRRGISRKPGEESELC